MINVEIKLGKILDYFYLGWLIYKISFHAWPSAELLFQCLLGRLYDAIESGTADLNDTGLKERIAGLAAIRDQARADAERAQAALDHAGNQAVSPDMIESFARKARQGLRLENGGYRRDHLRAFAQRSRSPTKRCISWDRNPNCCEHSCRLQFWRRIGGKWRS